jgi:hypothetical protein
MRTFAILTTLFAIGVIAGAIAFTYWSGFQGGPLDLAASLFANAPLMTKVLSLIQVPLALFGVVFGLVIARDLSRERHSVVLTVLSILPPALGVLLLINQGVYIHKLVVETNIADPKVYGVSVAEALLPLGIGLLAATPAAIANAVLAGRASARKRKRSTRLAVLG